MTAAGWVRRLLDIVRHTWRHRAAAPDMYAAYARNAGGVFPSDDYTPPASVPPPAGDVRLLAYYLPQFHPIPENDEWWGRGFTEWRNVARAFPVFDGHYQPRSPGELGYYDLRLVDVMRRQVELAKLYGIGGFVFHFYWFGGKRLLERPLENWLAHSDLDLPFSLCWANENWSRRWSGSEKDVLIAQSHSPEDDIALIRHVDRYFRDPRYLKIGGRPVFTVYRPALLPDPAATIVRWRAEAVRLGWPGLYLIATNAFDFADYRAYGFDALSEFPPHGLDAKNIESRLAMSPLRESGGRVRLYAEATQNAMHAPSPEGRIHPGVMPGWDNSPRRPRSGVIYHDATPELFGAWLRHAAGRARRNPEGERFVFVNAWNEWAEGAYLEPDLRFGYGFLEACADVLRDAMQPRTAIAVHAYYPDILEEILARVRPLAPQHKLFVTTVAEKEAVVRATLESTERVYTLRVLENRGRDILPFLTILPDIGAEGFEYVLKVHTKKTPRRRDGVAWRADLFDKLLGPGRLEAALQAFSRNPSLGLLGPGGHYLGLDAYIGGNRERVAEIARRLGLGADALRGAGFFAGSMFIARISAFAPLQALAFQDGDFAPENGQADGTLAHALERSFGLGALAAGMDVATNEGSAPLDRGYSFAR